LTSALRYQNLKKWSLYWILSFLVINLACHLSAGTNADSRFATLIAIAEDYSFQIDPYADLTSDWSRTPDGHYYSNKAPGPMLLAAPIFVSLKKIGLHHMADKTQRIETLIKYKASWLKLFSYLLQLIPFLFLTYLVAKSLIERGISSQALFLTLAALLFGNTAALFMSTYYGHGMTAVFILALILVIENSQYFWAGLFFGFAVLCDYSAILLALPTFFLLKRTRKNISQFVLGGILPLTLWIFYHSICFGSPLNIANKFQNPIYQDVASQSNNLWGILLPFPNIEITLKLLFGQSRGVIWVAPWIVVLISWGTLAVFRRRSHSYPKELSFSIVGFLLLLWMNSCFGGWHGGLTPGPRYLSPLFPVFALCLGLCFDQMPLIAQRILFVLVVFSIIFTALVYSTHIAPPETPLWPLYLKSTVLTPSSSTLARLMLVIPLLSFLGFKTLNWPKEST